jgi:hypothetical protein
MNEMRSEQSGSFAMLILIAILGLGAEVAYARYRLGANRETISLGVYAFVLAPFVASALQVAGQGGTGPDLAAGALSLAQGARHSDRFEAEKAVVTASTMRTGHEGLNGAKALGNNQFPQMKHV